MSDDPSNANESIVAKNASGTADEDELNVLIADAWRAALRDSNERSEIATLLGAPESELTQTIRRSARRSAPAE